MNPRPLPFIALLPWLLCTALGLKSQQDPLYTQYMYNLQLVNPAYAGSRDALTIAGLARTQWVAIEGHPLNQTLSLNAPLLKNHLGLGLAFLNDQIAETRIRGGQLDLAVRFPTGQAGSIAFGLKGSLWRMSEDLAELAVRDPNDQVFAENFRSPILANVGAGFYYLHPRWYLGVSVPELLENRLKEGVVFAGVGGLKQRHYYGIWGSIFSLRDRLRLRTSAFVKYTLNAPVQVGVTGRLEFHDKFLAGLMYRYHSAVGLLLGFNLTEQLNLGYSFDYSIGFRTGRYNNGSHEMVLRYDFLFRHSRSTLSPRYF